MVYSSKGIEDMFKNCQELYSVEQRGVQLGGKSGKKIKFIKKAGLPRISDFAREILEAPITEEEIKKALLESPPGKIPGQTYSHCFTTKNTKRS